MQRPDPARLPPVSRGCRSPGALISRTTVLRTAYCVLNCFNNVRSGTVSIIVLGKLARSGIGKRLGSKVSCDICLLLLCRLRSRDSGARTRARMKYIAAVRFKFRMSACSRYCVRSVLRTENTFVCWCDVSSNRAAGVGVSCTSSIGVWRIMKWNCNDFGIIIWKVN